MFGLIKGLINRAPCRAAAGRLLLLTCEYSDVPAQTFLLLLSHDHISHKPLAQRDEIKSFSTPSDTQTLLVASFKFTVEPNAPVTAARRGCWEVMDNTDRLRFRMMDDYRHIYPRGRTQTEEGKHWSYWGTNRLPPSLTFNNIFTWFTRTAIICSC